MKIIQLGAKIGPGKNAGKGNAGDTAIGSAFEYIFEKEFSSSTIDFMNCRKIFSSHEIDIINQADLLFLSGGGVFLHDTFPNDVSDWQWGISEELLEKIKIPIIVYAIGYNKFRNQRNFNDLFDKTVTKLVEKSIFFSMRNTGSCLSVQNHIPESLSDKIQLNFCPTLILNEKYNFQNSHSTKNVGFVFGGDRLFLRHANLNKFFEQINIFINYLKQRGIETILVNHQNDTWIKDYISLTLRLTYLKKMPNIFTKNILKLIL